MRVRVCERERENRACVCESRRMKSDERKRKRGGEISLDRNDFLGRNGAKLMMRFRVHDICVRAEGTISRRDEDLEAR